jgi:hypothetical protein
MNRKDFMVWHPMPNLDGIYDIEYIENINGLDIWLIPDSPNGNLSTNHKVLIHFDSYQSYTCIDESYCDGFWIDSPEKAWTFYKSKNSHYIEMLRSNSVILNECRKNIIHYVIAGTNSIFHVISDEEPDISIV